MILSLFLFASACTKETLCTCTKTTTKWTKPSPNSPVLYETPVWTSASTIVGGDAGTIEKECNELSVPVENTVIKWGYRMEGNETIFYSVEGNEVKVDCSIAKR